MLEEVYNKERFQSILEVMPEVFSLWKVVYDSPHKNSFVAPYRHVPYSSGFQEAEDSSGSEGYDLFFHFWAQKLFVLDRLNSWLEDFAMVYREVCAFLQGASLGGGYPMMPDPRDSYHNRRYEYEMSRRETHARIEWLSCGFPRIISCIAHKSDVTAIGRQHGGLAVVVRKAIFPQYPCNAVQGRYVMGEAIPADSLPTKDLVVTDSRAAKPIELHAATMALV